jgi:2-dehydropantoate 2-reductase
MRQVPYHPRYAVIGCGKVAQHFTYYFKLLQIAYLQWSSATSNDLDTVIKNSDIILLLITDSAIVSFIQSHPQLSRKTLVHFSGSLVTDLAYGAHPLMTFTKQLYSLPIYKSIPFVLDDNALAFKELFPALENPSFVISKADKPLYHSLCVMSGNFTCLLWKKFFDVAQNILHLPKAAIYPYLEQIFTNLRNDDANALSGPLARNDTATINANETALQSDPYQQVYQAFVAAYDASNNIKNRGRE